MYITKNKSGKIVVKSESNIESGKILKNLRPDYSLHVANEALYDFRVSGAGKAWKEIQELCVVDEDHCYDGLRTVAKQSVTIRYLYGNIIKRHGNCSW